MRPVAFLVCLWVVAPVVAFAQQQPRAATGAAAERAGAGNGAASRPVAGVSVEKGKAKIEYREFDPNKLPTPAPPLNPGEAAVCVYGFEIASDTRCTYTAPAPPAPGEQVEVPVRMTAVDVSLGLKVIVWLPKGVDDRLKAHEEGHRAIAERFYADAEKVARPIAAKWVGKTVTGKGHDAQAACREALDVVNHRVCDDILKALNEPCREAQDVFDKLTDHGRNERPTAKEAIEKAIEKVVGDGRGK